MSDGWKIAVSVGVAAAFVLVVFLTSRDTGPSAEIDTEAKEQEAQQAAQLAAADDPAPPAFQPPFRWEAERPTDAEFRMVIDGFCAESAALRAEEARRLEGVAQKRSWTPAEIESADLEADAEEAQRIYNGLTRAGSPQTQAAEFREWRRNTRERRLVLTDLSVAVDAEKAPLVATLSGELSALNSESNLLAAQLGLSCRAG